VRGERRVIWAPPAGCREDRAVVVPFLRAALVTMLVAAAALLPAAGYLVGATGRLPW